VAFPAGASLLSELQLNPHFSLTEGVESKGKDMGDSQHLGGPYAPAKVKQTCHGHNLVKVSRNCMNGLHIRTAITDTNLQHRTNFVTRLVPDQALGPGERRRLSAGFRKFEIVSKNVDEFN
jgi:hypothetical protein